MMINLSNTLKKKNNKKGFTLIELVVVIAILGILAALAIPRLTGARTNAADSTHNANVRMIESAISIYEAQNGAGDVTLAQLVAANLLESATIPVPEGTSTSLSGNYSITAGNIVQPAVIP